MNRWLKSMAGGLILASLPAAAADPPPAPDPTPADGARNGVRVIGADGWARPRSGAALLEMPALRQTVQDYSALEGGQIVIRHPGGEEGLVWAEELRAWLVALGIGSDAIRLEEGGAALDAIELSVRPAGRDRPR